MELVKYETIAVTIISGVILLSAALGGAQEGRQDRKDSNPVKVRIPFRYNPAGDGMTAIDPPSTDIKPSENQPSTDQPRPTPKQSQRSLLGYEKTSNGTLLRYSDGSTVELRPECTIETLCDGTKIEKLPTGTTIVRWPNGAGVIRNPDGTGAEFKPDTREPSRSGDLSPVPGTIELLPGGVIRQTLKDDGVVLDKYPDGTIRSRPDLVKPDAKTPKLTNQPNGKDLSTLPLNPFSRPTNVEKNTNPSKLLIPMMRPTIRGGSGRE